MKIAVALTIVLIIAIISYICISLNTHDEKLKMLVKDISTLEQEINLAMGRIDTLNRIFDDYQEKQSISSKQRISTINDRLRAMELNLKELRWDLERDISDNETKASEKGN